MDPARLPAGPWATRCRRSGRKHCPESRPHQEGMRRPGKMDPGLIPPVSGGSLRSHRNLGRGSHSLGGCGKPFSKLGLAQQLPHLLDITPHFRVPPRFTQLSSHASPAWNLQRDLEKETSRGSACGWDSPLPTRASLGHPVRTATCPVCFQEFRSHSVTYTHRPASLQGVPKQNRSA